MSNYAIPHDSYSISNSILTVNQRQKTGTLLANNKLVDNRIITSYVDTEISSSTIPTNASAKAQWSISSGDVSIPSQTNGNKEYYDFTYTEDSDADLITTYYSGGESFSRFAITGFETLVTKPAINLSAFFNVTYKTHLIEFSGNFKQSASKASGKYHNIVLSVENGLISDVQPSNFNSLLTFKVDSTQERNFSGAVLFRPNNTSLKYRVRVHAEERGPTGNRIYWDNAKINLTRYK
jgi:hypothetical protein